MRRLLVVGGVVLGALVLADRVTAVLAARAVSGQLRSSGELREDPQVSIRGFPFLTQAVGGRYDRVDLTAHDIQRTSLHLSRLDVVVRGARVPLGAALSGRVDAVPVESLSATGTIELAAVASETGLAEASIQPAGDDVEVTARLDVLGRKVVVTARSQVTLERSTLVLSPRAITVEGESSEALEDAVRDELRVRVSVGTLPYGLRLTGVEVTDDGLVLKGSSGPTVLQRP